MARPRAFIGSAKEHIALARAVQENLDDDFETTVWDQGVFGLSRYTLDALQEELDRSDLGIFVLAPLDLSLLRGRARTVPRDNVIFELGFFAGRLGYHRTFFITPMLVCIRVALAHGVHES